MINIIIVFVLSCLEASFHLCRTRADWEICALPHRIVCDISPRLIAAYVVFVGHRLALVLYSRLSLSASVSVIRSLTPPPLPFSPTVGDS